MNVVIDSEFLEMV